MSRLFIAVLLYSIQLNSFATNNVAIFAGGCFWCMESPYDKLDGVISTTSGYTGSTVANPTYKMTSSGTTGHYEAVQIEYDPDKISYQKLLNVFWMNIDPFDNSGQFCDKGPQYRAVIFARNEQEKTLAMQSKENLQKKLGNKATIVTQILPARKFYPAEDYHQDYYKKNPIRYKYYRYGCGRDKRLKQVQRIINSE